MEALAFIRSLIGIMHGVIAMRMLPQSGEMDMSDDRVKAVIADTFALIRQAHAAIVKASEEDADTKAKREKAHKEAATKFAALLESALQQKSIPAWAVAYREMTTTAKPVGGDRETADAVQKLHDDQRKMVVETFSVTNPFLADADAWIPRLGTKGRPAGSRNKPKDGEGTVQTETPPDAS